jgi:hypothetical protein
LPDLLFEPFLALGELFDGELVSFFFVAFSNPFVPFPFFESFLALGELFDGEFVSSSFVTPFCFFMAPSCSRSTFLLYPNKPFVGVVRIALIVHFGKLH